ncbi:MAG: hypothetical protein QOF86_1352, partial [Baekduia sp.]|nr:hypothetical protein [Baekduia sp.]
MVAVAAALVLILAGCGGGKQSGDPVDQVPQSNGLRDKVRTAQTPKPADFPATKGRTLQQVADSIGGGRIQAAMASSQFDVGTNRLAFGVIDDQGQFVYGRTAVYAARKPGKPAQGPFLAPADVLLTKPAYRSRQAATEQDPFSAIYAAQVPFRKPGKWTLLVTTMTGGKLVAAPSQVQVSDPQDDPIPRVGQMAPKVTTDTLASAKGDVSKIDTRQPPDDMHDVSFANVLGKQPVALLFATPQLCTSRVCGPVTDEMLQLKQKYGNRMEFIHQEVYNANDPNKGVRPPLAKFGLQSEPWLFTVKADGTIAARLEGSIGL